MKPITAAAIACASLALLAAGAVASTDIYRFEIAKSVEWAESARILTVRLLDVPGNRAIPDAAIFRRQMDIRHKSILAIGERHTPLQPDGQGNYRLMVPYPIAPGTTIKLGAHLPGRTTSVRGSIELPK